MQLFIIRHAEPHYASDSLTRAGKLEAAALAKRMCKDIRPDSLYSSPMGRAISTMRATEKVLSMKGHVLPWAKEFRFRTSTGAWDWRDARIEVGGRALMRVSSRRANATWNKQPPFDSGALRRSYLRVCAESDRFLSAQGYSRAGGRYACGAPNRKRIVVFCHNALALAWLAHLLEVPLILMWTGFWLAPSSVTTILFDEREPGWAVPRCVGLGDLSHLAAPGLRRSNVGLKANYE